MSHLLLSDDEIALLRWTCELFFVPESPVYFLEAEAREPRDFAQTYHGLLGKDVLDGASFRLTDQALNRLAPLTECDSRVMLVLPGDRDRLKVRDFYLLDEIAIEYEEQDHVHSVGQDQDQTELVHTLAKRFMPRRAAGDYLNLKLSPSEFMLLAVMCHQSRKGVTTLAPEALLGELRPALVGGQAEALSGGKKGARDGSLRQQDVRHRAAALLSVAPHEPSPAQEATAKADKPIAKVENNDPTQLARPRGQSGVRALPPLDDDVTAADHRKPKGKKDKDSQAAELALRGLIEKGVVAQRPGGIELRPSVASFAHGLSEKGRHTFVRYDFGDDEWFLRETSFLSVEGSLFVVSADEAGQLSVVELDGKRLESWLTKAVGPLPEPGPELAPGKSAKDFLLRA